MRSVGAGAAGKGPFSKGKDLSDSIFFGNYFWTLEMLQAFSLIGFLMEFVSLRPQPDWGECKIRVLLQ